MQIIWKFYIIKPLKNFQKGIHLEDPYSILGKHLAKIFEKTCKSYQAKFKNISIKKGGKLSWKRINEFHSVDLEILNLKKKSKMFIKCYNTFGKRVELGTFSLFKSL